MVTGLIFGNVFVASAQTATTTTASLQALIQTLQEQIKSLNAQMQAIKQAQSQVVATGGEIKDTLKLISQLREGAEGEDVKLLQAVLAADSTIYPEGRITGYYGKLTAQAVKRFQRANGLDQVGNVGPKTLEKIGAALEKNKVTTEVRNGAKTICAIVPPGHLIAPGWLKKQNGNAPIVPVCQTLPAGIAAKIGSATSTPPTATTTPDVVAPVITQIVVTGTTATGTTVTWTTNEAATSMVWYGTSTPVATGTASSVSSATLTQGHSVALTGLSANTTYYIIIGSTDAAGNTAMSAQYSFVTAALPDTNAPIMSSLSVVGITATSSRVTWTTNEAATGKVWYGTSTPVVTTGVPAAVEKTLSVGHDLLIDNLTAGTTYYYVVSSTDATGNVATSTEATFQTVQQSSY